MKFDNINCGTVYQCENQRSKATLFFAVPLLFENQTERLVIYKLSSFHQENGVINNINIENLKTDQFSLVHPNLFKKTIYFANGPLKVKLEALIKMQTFYLEHILGTLMNGIRREQIKFGDYDANPLHIMLISEVFSNLKALHEANTGGTIINRDLDVYRHCIYGAYIGAIDRNKKSRIRHHVLVWDKHPNSGGYFVFPLIDTNSVPADSETILEIIVNGQKRHIDINFSLIISESRFSYPLYDHINRRIVASISEPEIRKISNALNKKYGNEV